MPEPARPDPAQGVFETLLVLDGAPVELPAHLRRLAASVEQLYGEPLPERAALLARSDAAPIGLGRLQLTVAPREGGLECEATATEIDSTICFPGPERGAALRSLPLPGGLGAHKWADRSRLPGWEEAVPLIRDGEQILEASRANVFVAVGSVLSTPPPDGRILPGITRETVLELAREAGIETRERPLSRDQLRGADEVFLSGSVRGIEPAASLDGEELGRGERLGPALADSLRSRWRSGADKPTSGRSTSAARPARPARPG